MNTKGAVSDEKGYYNSLCGSYLGISDHCQRQFLMAMDF